MNAQTTAASGGKAAEANIEEFRLSGSPAHLLRRAQQFSSDIFTKAGLADSVTLRQTVVLAGIAEQEGRSQADLVRATGIDRSTLADMMARMERKGLIARGAAAADGRAKSVKLTASGRARLAEAAPALRKADAALLAALPRNKRKAFSDTLAALAEAAAEADEREIAEAKAAKKRAKQQKANAKERKKAKKKRRRRKRQEAR